MARYDPIRSDEELIEKIVPKHLEGEKPLRLRLSFQRDVKECHDFPELIARIETNFSKEIDKHEKEALLFMLVRTKQLWITIKEKHYVHKHA